MEVFSSAEMTNSPGVPQSQHRPDQPSPHDRGIDLGQRRRHRHLDLAGIVLGDGGAQPI
jgi:hypothetical protein